MTIMATPSISQEMLNYFMQLNDAEKKSVLEMLKTFLNSRKNIVQTLEEYKDELEEGDKEIEKGVAKHLFSLTMQLGLLNQTLPKMQQG